MNLIHECRSRANARERSPFDFAWHVLINVEIFLSRSVCPAIYRNGMRLKSTTAIPLTNSHGVPYYVSITSPFSITIIESRDLKSNDSLVLYRLLRNACKNVEKELINARIFSGLFAPSIAPRKSGRAAVNQLARRIFTHLRKRLPVGRAYETTMTSCANETTRR